MTYPRDIMTMSDKFGILKIYPTKPGGREWFIGEILKCLITDYYCSNSKNRSIRVELVKSQDKT